MKINIGKWLRRQALKGEPVTLENTVTLLLGKLGYGSLEEVALALMTGQTSAAKLKKTLDAQARETLRAEMLKAIGTLQEQVGRL